MITRQFTSVETQKASGDLQQQIRIRIDSLSYLPTTAAVAMKFVELGKNPDADPADYAKVISADSSLSSKLLALSNSSWAGVRNRITNVKMAVNLLGLGTVRTLAISYCMTGLHNELRLSAEESQSFWETSLCKAVAAKCYASLFDSKLADEAFVAGLFQDFALTVLYATARERYSTILQEPQISVQAQLQKERELFGVDHAEVGRSLAQRLELPELFIDTIAFHHDYERLSELVEQETLRNATYAAALLPHRLNAWSGADADTLAKFLREHNASDDVSAWLAEVQAEFVQLYTFFHEGDTPQAELTELLTQTAREAADNTTVLVERVNGLVREAAERGIEVHHRVKELEDEANRDQLTGVLNRQGFTAAAERMLTQAARYGVAFAVGYFDLDEFKATNDRFGHAFGDLVLKTVVSTAAAALPHDALLGRMGGDEFVFLLYGCTAQEAKQVVGQLVVNVAAKPICDDQVSVQIFLSAGLLCLQPSSQVHSLDKLIRAADGLMYQAKRAGGNRAEARDA